MSSALLALASSCGESPPELVSALFLDDRIPDGALEPGETVVLTFSKPVQLLAPSRTGLYFAPAGHTLGAYEIRPRERDQSLPFSLGDYQLAVVVGSGGKRVSIPGRFGDDAEATGVGVDLDRLPRLTSARGSTWSGVLPAVDLASYRAPPSHLERAVWIDRDDSFSVNEGDRIDLTWSRPVRIGDAVKAGGYRVPDDLFVLPVPGDRLSDGERPAQLVDPVADRTLSIVLGSRPHLDPQGRFELERSVVRGRASGIAVRGTSIRPTQGIVDLYGDGVADAHVIDVEGGGEPFRSVPGMAELGGELIDFTATELPGGRILVTGGMVRSSDRGRPHVSSSAYLFSVGGGWSEAIPMTTARAAHTATYLPGTDGVEGSPDDLVILAGGWNGEQRALNTVEAIAPFTDPPVSLPVHISGTGRPRHRYHHTAHLLPDWQLGATGDDLDLAGEIVLVGGYFYGARFNGFLELLRFRLSNSAGSPEVTAQVVRLGPESTLEYPRAHHQSLLLEDEGRSLLFVYGGYGGRGNPLQVSTSELTADTLAVPELILLERKYGGRGPGGGGSEITASRLVIPAPAEPPPGPREGHRLVLLEEERDPVLLVGGRRRSDPDAPDLRLAYRLHIDPDPGQDRPYISYRPAGQLLAPRSDLGVALLENGKVLVLGGEEAGTPSSRVELFNPVTDHFEVFCRDLLVPRHTSRVLELSEDDWLIVGGCAEEPFAELFRWRESR